MANVKSDLPYGGDPLCNGHKPQPSGTSPAQGAPVSKVYDTIAVDFDGTLCENRFPDIGEPKPLVIQFVKGQAAAGAKIILHTCREDGGSRPLLTEAVRFCEAHGIPLYAVNENPGNVYPAQFGIESAGRKVYADLYIDDKAFNTATIESTMERATQIVEQMEGGEAP